MKKQRFFETEGLGRKKIEIVDVVLILVLFGPLMSGSFCPRSFAARERANSRPLAQEGVVLVALAKNHVRTTSRSPSTFGSGVVLDVRYALRLKLVGVPSPLLNLPGTPTF